MKRKNIVFDFDNTLLPAASNPYHLASAKNILEQQEKFSPRKLLKMQNTYEKQIEKKCSRFARNLSRKKTLKRLSQFFDLYVLANGTLRTQLIKMETLDPKNKYFSGLVTSEEIGAEKPSKEAFEALLNKFNLHAKDCYFVGDSLDTDLLPAHALGMYPILSIEFTGLKKRSRLPRGVHVISSLDELLDIVL